MSFSSSSSLPLALLGDLLAEPLVLLASDHFLDLASSVSLSFCSRRLSRILSFQRHRLVNGFHFAAICARHDHKQLLAWALLELKCYFDDPDLFNEAIHFGSVNVARYIIGNARDFMRARKILNEANFTSSSERGDFRLLVEHTDCTTLEDVAYAYIFDKRSELEALIESYKDPRPHVSIMYKEATHTHLVRLARRGTAEYEARRASKAFGRVGSFAQFEGFSGILSNTPHLKRLFGRIRVQERLNWCLNGVFRREDVDFEFVGRLVEEFVREGVDPSAIGDLRCVTKSKDRNLFQTLNRLFPEQFPIERALIRIDLFLEYCNLETLRWLSNDPDFVARHRALGSPILGPLFRINSDVLMLLQNRISSGPKYERIFWGWASRVIETIRFVSAQLPTSQIREQIRLIGEMEPHGDGPKFRNITSYILLRDPEVRKSLTTVFAGIDPLEIFPSSRIPGFLTRLGRECHEAGVSYILSDAIQWDQNEMLFHGNLRPHSHPTSLLGLYWEGIAFHDLTQFIEKLLTVGHWETPTSVELAEVVHSPNRMLGKQSWSARTFEYAPGCETKLRRRGLWCQELILAFKARRDIEPRLKWACARLGLHLYENVSKFVGYSASLGTKDAEYNSFVVQSAPRFMDSVLGLLGHRLTYGLIVTFRLGSWFLVLFLGLATLGKGIQLSVYVLKAISGGLFGLFVPR